MPKTTTADIPPIKDISTIAAENNPERVAGANGLDGSTVTWAEFDERSQRIANAFSTYVTQGDRIAFLCEASVEHHILWNGALKTGGIVSNLHTRASNRALEECFRTIKPRILIIDPEYSEYAAEHVIGNPAFGVEVVITTGTAHYDHEQEAATLRTEFDPDEPDVQVGEDDIAVVQWTSGTTGAPKGWALSNKALAMRGMKLANKKQFSRLTKVANIFTPSFSAWYSTAIPAMLANAGMYFQPDWDPEGYLELVEQRELTSTNLVPTMWREILRVEELDAYDLSSFEKIEVGGETLDRTTLERLHEHICDTVTQSYAATEIVGTSMSSKEMEGNRIDSVGKPLMGTQIRVIERSGAPTDVKSPGDIGEVIVKGSDAASWVWGNTEKTRESFTDGWWYSGDLGYKDEAGYLFIEGRVDNMILSKGIKVFPTPVEERLNDHPEVIESAVIGMDDDEYGQKVTAFVRPKSPDLTADELDQWCLDSDTLARIERPRDYRFRDGTFPRTSSGKLNRNELVDDGA